MDSNFQNFLKESLEIIGRRSRWLEEGHRLNREDTEHVQVIRKEVKILGEVISRLQDAIDEVMRGGWQK